MVKPAHKRSRALRSTFVSAYTSPLTTRERSELIGAGLGAAGGAIIGGTAGLMATGALIGGPVGLIAGLLIGDRFMDQKTAPSVPHNDRHEGEVRTIE